MSLKDLDIKKFYDSDSDDILNSFYIPALSSSVKYQRLAGFFSSSSFAIAARGIAGLIANNGKMELICSPKLKKEDKDAIVEGSKKRIDVIEKSMLEDLKNLETLQNELIINHVKALGWMITNGLLEIKVAIVTDLNTRPLDYVEVSHSGIFHQKVGILQDTDGNRISFSGSDNESAIAWQRNIEEFKVFRSWDETEKEYLKADCDKFHKFWFGEAKRVEVIDVPSAVRKKLIEIAPNNIDTMKLNVAIVKEKKKEIKLWNHQIAAVKKWFKNNKKCIFEMATGTGKTFTALECLKQLALDEKKLITIIACPYSHLIKQWHDNLDEFGININSIIADSTNPKWKNNLTDCIRNINNNIDEKLVIFTTHNTFYSKDFIHIINIVRDSKFFLIGDEVHGMWSEERKRGFIEVYHFRLGLSATPSRWFDPEGTNQLLDYFNIKSEGDKFSFSLEDAIKTINPHTGQTYLTPYEYKPYFCELTEEEFSEYIRKTKKLARLYYSTKNNKEKIKLFNLIAIKRQEIIKNAANKYNTFQKILKDIKDLRHCLVYCESEQIEEVQEILYNNNIIFHKFTKDEDAKPKKEYGGISERDNLLFKFKEGKFKILVAIKCLDEGIDIPQAKIGIILASTGNPRQYIQRRGRLLRRFSGKTKAIIYDIIVLPLLGAKIDKNLMSLEERILRKEFQRYEEFSKIAINKLDCIKKIIEIEESCNLIKKV